MASRKYCYYFDMARKPLGLGKPRKLLVDPKYRARCFVFASHPELFSIIEAAEFLKVNRDTASRDLKEVLSLGLGDTHK